MSSALQCVPISDSDISQHFRISVAKHVISKCLTNNVWQPFYCGILHNDHKMVVLLSSVSEKLAAVGQRSESAWRALTLLGLESLKTPVVDTEEVIVREMIRELKPFTNHSTTIDFHDELLQIVHNATMVWKIAQKDSSRIWIDKKFESQSVSDNGSDNTLLESPVALCLFPRVLRMTQSEGQPNIKELHPGLLFSPDSNKLEEARQEAEALQRRRLEALESLFDLKHTDHHTPQAIHA